MVILGSAIVVAVCSAAVARMGYSVERETGVGSTPFGGIAVASEAAPSWNCQCARTIQISLSSTCREGGVRHHPRQISSELLGLLDSNCIRRC